MKRRVALLALAVLGLTAADGSARARRAYEREYREHTRELTVTRDFSTALKLRGTLLTEDFRDTLAAERQRLLDPTDDNHERFVTRMDDDAGAYHEVVFSADSSVPGKMLFGPGDDRWNVRLEADGTLQELVTVYRVRRPTPLHRGLYPHITKWSELYIARFHRSVAHPQRVVFHVGSGHGHGELVWEGEAVR